MCLGSLLLTFAIAFVIGMASGALLTVSVATYVGLVSGGDAAGA